MYHFTVFRGISLSLPLQYVDSTGALVDLSGCTFSFNIYQNKSRTTLVSPLDESHCTITYADDWLTVAMTALQTEALTKGEKYYELLISWPNGDVTMLLNGAIEVT